MTASEYVRNYLISTNYNSTRELRYLNYFRELLEAYYSKERNYFFLSVTFPLVKSSVSLCDAGQA